MRISRTVPFALAGLSFAIALYLEMTFVMMFGFWDGFTSELDRAENVLARYFIWFSLAMGLWFIGLGIRPSHPNFKRRVLYSCLFFVFVAGVAVSLDLYFRTYMMDSAGG